MIRNAARIVGIIYLIAGIAGFIPGLAQPDPTMPGMSIVLGLFPVNLLHNVVHLLVGLAGLGLAGSLANARTYFKTLAVVFALLAILGSIQVASTLWGLLPLGGLDIGLHALTAILAIYFGWIATETSATA